MATNAIDKTQVVDETRRWLKQIVLRHNLCPFAHQPFQQETISYVVSEASTPQAVADDLIQALLQLRDCDANDTARATTLLITPHCFADFGDYNEFLNVVDAVIEQLQLDGIIQIASFHPAYQFADLNADDVRNYTNRSLYPMFHLILEAHITEARATHPDVASIPQTNMELLEKQGLTETLRQLDACRMVNPDGHSKKG